MDAENEPGSKAVKREFDLSNDYGRQPLTKRQPIVNSDKMGLTQISLITPYINKFVFYAIIICFVYYFINFFVYLDGVFVVLYQTKKTYVK